MLGRVLSTMNGTIATISCGGAKMLIAVIERTIPLLPDITFTNAYGLTETSSRPSVPDPRHTGSRPIAKTEVELD